MLGRTPIGCQQYQESEKEKSMFKKMSKTSLVALIILALYAVITPSANAGQDNIHYGFEGRPNMSEIPDIMELEAETGTINEGWRVLAIKQANGIATHIESPRSKNLKGTFDVQSDLKQRTFRVVKRQSNEPIDLGEKIFLSPQMVEFSRYSRITSYDPIGIKLCITALVTYLNGDWTTSQDFYPWANPETEVLTHWYTKKYYLEDPYKLKGKMIWNALAVYYNYDFLDISKITKVRHQLQVKMWMDGTAKTIASVIVTGEKWYLIGSAVTINPY